MRNYRAKFSTYLCKTKRQALVFRVPAVRCFHHHCAAHRGDFDSVLAFLRVSCPRFKE